MILTCENRRPNYMNPARAPGILPIKEQLMHVLQKHSSSSASV